jgi:hypothetical protein
MRPVMSPPLWTDVTWNAIWVLFPGASAARGALAGGGIAGVAGEVVAVVGGLGLVLVWAWAITIGIEARMITANSPAASFDEVDASIWWRRVGGSVMVFSLLGEFIGRGPEGLAG